ncbi:cofilin [Nematocida minor]|uniref:cofilin n=1 Tax=Nematocida minor TaxID=1912983 RepID=UPI00221FF732|nr:cofilin [Nematocida minor]KAI5192710.1 cofilin [Nematocida minor]
MAELGENFNTVLEHIEKVRRKELLYMVFSFQGTNTTQYEIKELKDNPSALDKFIVKQESELEGQFEQFKKQVKEYGCCYALFDFEANHSDGTPRSALFLFTLIPDGFTVKEKFLYSFHLQQFIGSLKTAVKLVQINQYEDLNYETMKKICLALKKG